MATSKTLTPTNVTIQIPEFTDQPDQRVNSNCIDKEADAINALNSNLLLQNRVMQSSTGFPNTGITYMNNALANLEADIASASSGVVVLNSSGGPVFHAILFKYANNYYSGIMMTYNSENYYPTIAFRRNATTFEVTFLSKIIG